MAIDTLGGGRIEPQDLAEEMRTSYLDYAMSVIVSRALPDVRDGLEAGAPAGAALDERGRPAAGPAVLEVLAGRR